MRAALIFGLAALWAAGDAHAASGHCRADLTPSLGAAAPAPRDVSADDLLRLRDLGGPYQQVAEPMFSLSPDGSKIAFQLRRADPRTNGYCLGIFVLDLKREGPPRLLDDSDAFIMHVTQTADYGYAPSGMPEVVTPRWSPSGRSLAYLKRVNGLTQAWRVDLGASPTLVSRSAYDVEAVAWADDDTVVYADRPGVAEAAARIAQDGAAGYLYDARFDPTRSTKPRIPGGIPQRYSVLNAAGLERPATDQERARIGETPFEQGDAKEAGVETILLTDAQRRPTGDSDPGNRKTRSALRVHAGDWQATCDLVLCDAVLGAWLDAKAMQVLFIKRPAWSATGSEIYGWRRGEVAPRLLLRTPSHLVGCALGAGELICGEETAVQPRRLVAIDPRTGRTRLLFDPNPEFSHLRLGQTQVVRWINENGFKAAGTLVLPPSHKAGVREPLVVVQYLNRGFLRGGTGDEYPIHLFAAKGLAVLALNEPLPLYYQLPMADQNDVAKVSFASTRDWAERKNIQASLEAGLNAVIALGVVDPDRLGITGFSGGGQTLEWALVHSRRFAAAAVSNCCNDRYVTILGSQQRVKRMRMLNQGRDDISSAEYDRMSLEHNAAVVSAPLLMQMSDSELMRGLPTFASLDSLDKPVELYVYPDEFHNKWQPAHRAAIYQRSLDWFRFWLSDQVDPDPAKAEQYARWRALKDRALATEAARLVAARPGLPLGGAQTP